MVQGRLFDLFRTTKLWIKTKILIFKNNVEFSQGEIYNHLTWNFLFQFMQKILLMFYNGQKSPNFGKNKLKNCHMFIIWYSWWENINLCILRKKRLYLLPNLAKPSCGWWPTFFYIMALKNKKYCLKNRRVDVWKFCDYIFLQKPN